jgi:hypothetical protein
MRTSNEADGVGADGMIRRLWLRLIRAKLWMRGNVPDDANSEQLFTMETEDKNADESLLDLTGYDIVELEF